MLWTAFILLMVLWLAGMATSTMGNLIHIVPALAMITVLIRVVQGRRPLR